MKRAWLLAGALPLMACSDVVASCAPERSLAGTWRYAGGEDAPATASLEGSLEITTESCEGFQGRLDILRSVASGSTARLAGPVSGRLTSGGSIRFDAWLAGVARQHLAVLGQTGAEGHWLVARGAAGVESGTFRLTREP
jgi:hypothetical protein